jgi:hypothetical protein
MVDFSLTEINQPLSFIFETPITTPPISTDSEPNNFESEEVGSNLETLDDESDNMGDNNENILEGNDHHENNQPWLDRDALAILGWLHNFPRNLENLLPKFDPKT